MSYNVQFLFGINKVLLLLNNAYVGGMCESNVHLEVTTQGLPQNIAQSIKPLL